MTLTEDNVFWRIIMMRGLGYDMKDISVELHMTVEQVRYRVRGIRNLAIEQGDERVFFQAVKSFLDTPGLKNRLGDNTLNLY